MINQASNTVISISWFTVCFSNGILERIFEVYDTDTIMADIELFLGVPLYQLEIWNIVNLCFEHLILCFKGLNLLFEIFNCLNRSLKEWFITYKYELMRLDWCNLYESSLS